MFGKRFFPKTYFAGSYFNPIDDGLVPPDPAGGSFPYPIFRRRGRR